MTAVCQEGFLLLMNNCYFYCMRIFLLAILSLFCLTIQAQTHKAFIGKDGSVVDSSKATSYIIYNKVSDTIWVAKQYGMNGVIITVGTYKDANLGLPNGRFFYYHEGDLIWENEHKIGHVDAKAYDTSNYITKTGAFSNGKRTGKWIMLNRNGGRIRLDTYLNDEQNGVTELYAAYSDTTVIMRGNYVKNLKEGYWDSYNSPVNITSSELYERGKHIKAYTSYLTFGSPGLPDKYIDYLKDNLGKILTNDITAKYNVAATVTKNGKLMDPVIVGFDSETLKMKDQIVKIISKCTLLWKPTYDTKLKQIIDENVIFSIVIKDGQVESCYINSSTVEAN